MRINLSNDDAEMLIHALALTAKLAEQHRSPTRAADARRLAASIEAAGINQSHWDVTPIAREILSEREIKHITVTHYDYRP